MEAAIRFRYSAEARPETHHVVMALKAKREHRWTPQQTGVRAAVRLVTHRAALDAHGRVLKSKGATLIAVALDAWDIVTKAVRDHAWRLRRTPSSQRRAVWVMAVGAIDGAFVDAVFEG